MRTLPLQYSSIPGYPRLFLEFLQAGSVSRFYSPYSGACVALAELVERRRLEQFPREQISRALQTWNASLNNSRLALSNAERISKQGVLAVVTGQQAGLFGGPALSVYKAVSAVLLARKLEQDGFAAVPIFWAATEDHDFDEIRHTTFVTREGELTELRLEKSSGLPLPAASRPVGDQARLFQQLQQALGRSDHARTVLEWLREAYRPEVSLGEAFAHLLARMLGHTGLVLLDASDPEIRRLSRLHYVRAIEQADEVQHLLQQRTQELVAAGFAPQVYWDVDYTLLFHVGPEGRRAIRRKGDEFVAGNKRWSSTALVDEIAAQPEQFSPSALLRPLIQDAIIPSILYVGGPAEVAYFAQVQALSPVFGWAPVIEPRLSVLLLDRRAWRYMERNTLQPVDLLCPLEQLQERMVTRKLKPGVFSAWDLHGREVSGGLDAMFDLAGHIDPSVAGAVQTSRRKIDYQFNKVRRKMLRVASEKDRLLKSHAAYLHNLAYPGELPQERRINFLSFYARFGPALLEGLFSLSPCDKHSHVVVLE